MEEKEEEEEVIYLPVPHNIYFAPQKIIYICTPLLFPVEHMATNAQIRKDIQKAILDSAPAMPEMETLMPYLALQVGWRRETVIKILKDMVDAKVIEIKNGLITEPKKSGA